MIKIKEINEFIAKHLWFDFEVKSFDGGTLIVVAGIDLFYDWLIELTFINVSFVLLRSDWKGTDNLNTIEILTGQQESFIKDLYFIENDYLIFAINHQDVNDGSNQYIVAAYDIDYNIKIK